MLIECPSCHARAKLPDTKEGAKVRCGECGRVYVAQPHGGRRRGARKSSSGPVLGVAIGGAALLALLVIYRQSNKGTSQAQTAGKQEVVEEVPEPKVIDDVGWDAPVVQAAVALHQAAAEFDENKMSSLLYGPGMLATERAMAAGLDEVDPSAGEEFLLLPRSEQDAHMRRWVEDITRGEGKDLIADWRPFDGQVIEESDMDAIVRLAVTPRDASQGVGKRWVQWRLARDNGRWRAWGWERWLSPEERAAEKKRGGGIKGVEKVTLADGSKVYERPPEELGHLEDTPQELRDRIDSLYVTMIDLDLTKESKSAQAELVEIGRPAIPILLTGLYSNPLSTQDEAIQCNLVVQALRKITGEHFGFKPQVLEGSGTGTTEERRTSAIRQWFAWWYRYEDRFLEKAATTDGLEEYIELTEKEKRWLERNKD